MNIKIDGLLPILLGLLFIGLKLSGHITWSWLWVLSPFWIPIAFIIAFLAVVAIVAVISAAMVR